MSDTVTVAVPEGVALTADAEQAWRAVELWPLRIERWTGDRWYVLIGLPLLLWITIGAVFAAKGTHYTTGILLFLAFALVLCAGLTASGIAFRLWHARFRDAFPALLRARSLVTLGETTDECMQRFTIDYQRYLFSPWRYVLVGAIVAFTTGRLRGRGRVCVEWDPVGVPRRTVPVEDDEDTLRDPDPHHQPKQPERELVASIRLIDALRKKSVEHASLLVKILDCQTPSSPLSPRRLHRRGERVG